MSQVLPKEEAEKIVFTFQPKSLKGEMSEAVSEYIGDHEKKKSDFQLDPIVAQQSGVATVQRRNLEAQVEAAVLERMKEVQEQAYAKSYELGLHEGSEKAFVERKQDLENRIRDLDAVFAELNEVKTKALRESEAVLIKLVFNVAEKIAQREISLNQEPILDMIKQLVESIQADDRVNLNVSENDYAFIEELRKRSQVDLDFKNVKLIASPSIQAGGCILESNFGTVDASVPQRVEKVWASLKQKLPNLRGHNVDLVADAGQADDTSADDSKADGSDDGSEPQS